MAGWLTSVSNRSDKKGWLLSERIILGSPCSVNTLKQIAAITVNLLKLVKDTKMSYCENKYCIAKIYLCCVFVVEGPNESAAHEDQRFSTGIGRLGDQSLQ
ncbi:hypothetical protein PHYBLDRAFT_70303 [Phycomyces blakesleeanus NRRL 1555(-)]|uniref:Uncharacterized protein n=1 Tax=Phycomyces blakesleeanus (strain ATCC 8743b / DSM 1359 / FGSC 10004 / NBRC 33097 / NRRL 1555) TaxID=763407 RepID=A0A162TGG1_PHYB8|nr:hypothetical protein PHYBLDRAFT_70303 [Phycomyces blakesleeanus NRRL 1555(-)]OAD66943.1 hypothetical protein PHYBLDRAFT_70303 [Phycomyces blakesleeanus NRRL 1555(-)]|eukprot:XP_018284983.1 hypothetical protein PHYBLDRAFT_70303 [Phycomyces blakesleeanus NRRL 1555(-)]